MSPLTKTIVYRIHHLPFNPVRGQPLPADVRLEAGFTLNSSPVYCRTTDTDRPPLTVTPQADRCVSDQDFEPRSSFL